MTNFETRLSAIEREIEIRNEQLIVVSNKVDQLLTQFQTLTVELNKIVAIHTTKIQVQEQDAVSITKLIENEKAQHLREMKEILRKIEESEKRILETISSDRVERLKQRDDFEVRIKSLERWKYTVLGSVAALGFFAKSLVNWIISKI